MILTEASADVDVEVDTVVTIVHQIAVAHFDQRVEVVLLAVRVEHVTGHLEREEAASNCSTHISKLHSEREMEGYGRRRK